MAPRGRGYTLSRDGLRRVRETVRAYERSPRSLPPPTREPRVRPGGAGGLIPGRAPVAGIDAGAVGSVTLYESDPETGALSLGTEAVEARNDFPGKVAGNAFVWMTYFGGFHRVVIEACVDS